MYNLDIALENLDIALEKLDGKIRYISHRF